MRETGSAPGPVKVECEASSSDAVMIGRNVSASRQMSAPERHVPVPVLAQPPTSLGPSAKHCLAGPPEFRPSQ